MINKFLATTASAVYRLRQTMTRSLRSRRLIAFIPAIIATSTVASYIFDLEREKDTWGTREWVYVATRDLTPSAQVEKESIKRIEAPLHLIPPDAITTQPTSALVRSVAHGTILLKEHFSNSKTSANVPFGWVIAGVSGVDRVIDLHQGDSIMLMADGQTVCARGWVSSYRTDSLSGDLSVAVAVPIECAVQMSGVTSVITLAVHSER